MDQLLFGFAKVNTVIWFKTPIDRKGESNKYLVRFGWEGLSHETTKSIIGIEYEHIQNIFKNVFRFEESNNGFSEITAIKFLSDMDECLEVVISPKNKCIYSIKQSIIKIKTKSKN